MKRRLTHYTRRRHRTCNVTQCAQQVWLPIARMPHRQGCGHDVPRFAAVNRVTGPWRQPGSAPGAVACRLRNSPHQRERHGSSVGVLSALKGGAGCRLATSLGGELFCWRWWGSWTDPLRSRNRCQPADTRYRHCDHYVSPARRPNRQPGARSKARRTTKASRRSTSSEGASNSPLARRRFGSGRPPNRKRPRSCPRGCISALLWPSLAKWEGGGWWANDRLETPGRAEPAACPEIHAGFHTFMGGVQYRLSRVRRSTRFVQVLAGRASFAGTANELDRDVFSSCFRAVASGFALAAGGGVDVHLTDRLAFRPRRTTGASPFRRSKGRSACS